jgi:hypothetical protein
MPRPRSKSASFSPLGRLANAGTCASFNHQLEQVDSLRAKVAESR